MLNTRTAKHTLALAQMRRSAFLTSQTSRSFIKADYKNDSEHASRRNTGGFRNFGFGVIVGQEFAVMLHRFEKFHVQLQPGFNFKIPIIDKVQYVHDLREQVIEIPP